MYKPYGPYGPYTPSTAATGEILPKPYGPCTPGGPYGPCTPGGPYGPCSPDGAVRGSGRGLAGKGEVGEPGGAVVLFDGERLEGVAVAGAAEAGAGCRIEAGAVGGALDLAGCVVKAAVAQVDRLRAVRADIQVRPQDSVGGAEGEGFAPVVDGKAHRPARGGQLRQRGHFFGVQGISRPPARRLAARAMTKSRSERRFR